MLLPRKLHVVTMLRAVALLVVCAAPAGAACPEGAEVLVSCTLKGGAKQLDTCLIGDHAMYRYGPTGAVPELDLLHPVTDVDMEPWPGVSRTIWEAVRFANKDVIYEVYYSIERDPEATEMSGGVTVLRGEETLASLACDPGSVTSGGYSLPLYEAKQAAGQCWNTSEFRWKSC